MREKEELLQVVLMKMVFPLMNVRMGVGVFLLLCMEKIKMKFLVDIGVEGEMEVEL